MADEHLQHLMKLIEAKQVYTSYALLKKIPADTYIPGKQKILDELKSALSKGNAIHAILQNSRNNGDYPTALKQGLKLQQIVPDYPNLKHDIAAIEKTLANLGSILSKAKIAASHGHKKDVIKLLQTVRQIDAHNEEIPLIEKTVRNRALKKSSTSIIVSVLILVLPCLLYGVEKVMVWQAQENLKTASHLISTNKFTEANKAIAKMQGKLKFVYVFNTVDKNTLIDQAKNMQSSITFVQGMRGRVIHDGEYINKKKKNSIKHLETLIWQAAQYIENNKWQEALGKYNESLEFIQQHEAEIGSEQSVIIEKIAELELKENKVQNQQATEECLKIITLANEAYANKDVETALQKYEEAFDFANQHNITETCKDEQTAQQYNSSIIISLLDQGNALKTENPSEAIDYFQQAKEHAIVQNMDEATIQNIQAHINSIQAEVFMAKVQILIKDGDRFIAQNDYKNGLSKYNFGLILLEGNTEVIAGKDTLTTDLITKISKTEQQAALTTHTAYLETIAENSLRTFFAVPPQDKLEKTTITFMDQKDAIFTYRISAKSIREKVMYELIYQFDANSGEWKVVQ